MASLHIFTGSILDLPIDFTFLLNYNKITNYQEEINEHRIYRNWNHGKIHGEEFNEGRP